jgi:2-hydroxy-6-oxonona-2,4-dienedioate hydrolase
MNEERYRESEARLWRDAGVAPRERRVHLPRNDVEVRIQEVGEGPPVLFLHGGPGAAGSIWAYLAARLPELRCLLLDRPGTGLSAPSPLGDPAAVCREADTLVVDVLDALGIDSAHVVGSSHGSFIALRSAAAHGERIERMVHLGCPGFVDGMVLRSADRLVLLPGVARLYAALPPSERSLRSVFRQLGHGKVMEAGGIPQPLIDCSLALARDTDTMRNDLASMASMGGFRRGFDPSLTLDRELLARVEAPTLVLWGGHEPYGDEVVARRLVDALPAAELEVLPDAGHLCWLDDVARAAEVVRGHLLTAGREEHRAATLR